jgi:hypothetical protein
LSEKALIACSFYLKLIFGNLTSIQPCNEDSIMNVSLSFKLKIKISTLLLTLERPNDLMAIVPWSVYNQCCEIINSVSSSLPLALSGLLS